MSVILLSGGVDSLVLLAQEVAEERVPALCVGFDYGQRHRKELQAAARIAEHYRTDFFILPLPALAFSNGSALTAAEFPIPKGLHWEDPKQVLTVVPNRNLVMLSCAAALASKVGVDRVLFGAHAGDAAIYPDCRPSFVEAADKVMQLACKVAVVAPFLGMNKRDIVELGRSLRVPFDLTWSCYEGKDKPCGQCGACLERREAGV